MKDPNTGALSGYSIEIVNEVGRLLGLKVEWAVELQWSTLVEGLGTRTDIVASTAWLNSSRAKVVFYSAPVVFSGVGVWVRADDPRFDRGLEAINSPDIRIAAADGELAEVIAQSDFPRAKIESLGQLSDVSMLLQQVVSRKADVSLMENNTAYLYVKKNPGKIKNVAMNNPVRVFPECFLLPSGDMKLKMMIDGVLMELLNSGFVDKVIAKYEQGPGGKYRVARPYRPAMTAGQN